jgi:hypothetical protein
VTGGLVCDKQTHEKRSRNAMLAKEKYLFIHKLIEKRSAELGESEDLKLKTQGVIL